MTEQEWLECVDPEPMLEFLRGKVSDRKLRLFPVACCRRIWHLIVHPVSRAAVDLAERFVDGLASADDLWEGAQKAEDIRGLMGEVSDENADENGNEKLREVCRLVRNAGINVDAAAEAADEASGTVEPFPFSEGCGGLAAAEAVACAMPIARAGTHEATTTERAAQADLLREIIGNPFRAVTLDPSWLTATVAILAQGIYDEKAFDRLPILADALEDAGCTNEEILNHCRQPGEHARGCWAVDLVLKKC